MHTITTRTARLFFEGHLLTTELIDNIEIDVEDVMENYQAAMKLTQGKKIISLVIAAPYSSLTKEARAAANIREHYAQTVAQAIIIKSLANRLMGNFLIKFYNPPCPCLLFKKTEKAMIWLEEEWNKVNEEIVSK